MTARLPVPGRDDGAWGTILNQFLEVSLNNDGTLRTSTLSAAGGELTANKGVASGYAELGSGGTVPAAQLGVGTAGSSNYLRGDGVWAVPSTALASNTDVSLTPLGNAQVLTYDSTSSKWTNQVVPTRAEASSSSLGLIQLSGDLGGTATVPTVVSTHLTSALPVNQGGTGVATSTGTGSVVLSASPAFTGIPTAPTATAGTNTTQLATTAFVSSAVTSSGSAQGLTATSVKTSGYAANPGDFVVVDASSGSVTITLPTTPTTNTRIGVKMINVAGSYTTTISSGSGDFFNTSSGGATLTLSLLYQGVLLQYTNSIWYVQADDLTLSQLDARYVNNVNSAALAIALG